VVFADCAEALCTDIEIVAATAFVAMTKNALESKEALRLGQQDGRQKKFSCMGSKTYS
jgi:hypothetical protein